MNETRTKGRWRTPIAIVILLVYLFAYIGGVVWLMERTESWALAIRALLFCVFGILWILPLGPLLRWSAKDPNSQLKNPD